MNSLDENLDFIDQADVPARPLAMRYGGIAALVFIAITLLLDTTGLINYSTGEGQYYPAILATIATLVILYYAIKQHRDEELGGYVTFGRCVKLAALIGLFSGILIGIFGYIYHGFIRPDIVPAMMEFQQEQLAEQGMTEEQIEQAMSFSAPFTTPLAIAITSIFNGVFWLYMLVYNSIKKTSVNLYFSILISDFIYQFNISN